MYYKQHMLRISYIWYIPGTYYVVLHCKVAQGTTNPSFLLLPPTNNFYLLSNLYYCTVHYMVRIPLYSFRTGTMCSFETRF